ncbi:cation transporter [Azospirillum halopraeferens]|uniref:cation transporter n=1 Tax=Azospirillum halopraeferens TaxID=34010 RepID=UPI0003F9F109|nr:cation transporter [Azospirillum halopraeferens]
MAGCCGGSCGTGAPGDRQADFRRILRAALVINALMFAVETAAGIAADSMALRADALNFLANAATHGVSLWVLGRALEWRSRAVLAKGLLLGAMGLWVIGSAAWNAAAGTVPDAPVMSLVGLLALGVNLSLAAMLFAGRRGGATLRSVWLCARNDAMASIAVMAAAAGVWSTATGWPDTIVAGGIAALCLSAAWSTIRQARAGMRALYGGSAVDRTGPGGSSLAP